MTIARDKQTYLRYRERAREIYRFDDPDDPDRIVKIPLQANVQMCEGGAFVEAMVWVPEKKL